jgi:hypothetical protein
MFPTRFLRVSTKSFRLGVAKSYVFELVEQNKDNESCPTTGNNTTTSTTDIVSTKLMKDGRQPVVLSPSSFASAETLNATLDKYIQEGQTINIWVPASVLRQPKNENEPLLLNMTTRKNSTQDDKTAAAVEAVANEETSLLVEWQAAGVQSLAARDLSPRADGGTHLPGDLVRKMSPHYQQQEDNNNNTTSNTKNKASQLLVTASTNADKMLLLKALTDASPSDEIAAHGASPLHLLASSHASSKDAIECIHILLDKGAMIDQRASNGSTPLHWAAGNGNYEIAKELLRLGADPSIMTFTWFRDVFGKDSGQTPLHWASESGYINIVNLILDHAPWIVGSTDERGATPSSLALREFKFDTHDRLKEREEEAYVLLSAKLEGMVAVPISGV